MKNKLTARQQEITDFLRDFMTETGMPPTRMEICEQFGFRSPNAAEQHLRALANKGVIEMIPGASRGVRLVGQYAQAPGFDLPIIGQVAAGAPILAEEHIERRVSLEPALFSPRPHYLLRVRGMSMRDAGILDGDLLAVHRTAEARNGQIVVARIDDEVTVKRLQVQGRKARLLPANPEFEPIEIDLKRQTLSIEGLGVGVIRSL